MISLPDLYVNGNFEFFLNGPNVADLCTLASGRQGNVYQGNVCVIKNR